MIERQLVDDDVEQLRLLDRFADADVDHDLLQRRNLVRVPEAELLRETRTHRLLVVLAQTRRRNRLVRAPACSVGSSALRSAPRPPDDDFVALAAFGGVLFGAPPDFAPLPPFAPPLPPFLLSCCFVAMSMILNACGNAIESPLFTLTRSLRSVGVDRRARTRVGAPDFGSSSITFEAAIGASTL